MGCNPGPSPALEVNECHEPGASSGGLKGRRRPATGGTCDSEKESTALPLQGLVSSAEDKERSHVTRMKAIYCTVR